MPMSRPKFRAFAVLVAAGAALLVGPGAVGDPASGVKEFPAVRGDRTSGWLAQTRSEVLARNGVVPPANPWRRRPACKY